MIDEEKLTSEDTPNEAEAPVEEAPTDVQETPSEDTHKKGKKEKKPKSKVRVVLEWVFTVIFAGLFIFFGIGQITGMINKQKNYGQTLTYNFATFVITTNSMEPDYPVGTAIITYKENPEVIAKDFLSGKVVDVTMFNTYLSNAVKYDYYDYQPGNITYGGIEYKLEGNPPVYPSGNAVITHRLIDVHIEEGREVGNGKYTFVIAGINTEGQLSKEGQYQLLTENELLGIVKVKSNVLGGFFRFITSPWGLLIFLLVPAFYLVITSVLDIFKAMKEPDEEEASGGSGDKPASTSTGTSRLDSLSEKEREALKKQMLDEMLNGKKGKD